MIMPATDTQGGSVDVNFSNMETDEVYTDAPTASQEHGMERPSDNVVEKTFPKSRFWEGIVLWSQSTTFHGIHYVTEMKSHTFRRVAWFVFIASAWVLAILYCQAQTSRYFEYKTLMLHIVYRNQRIKFPAVSICKRNFVLTDSVNTTEKVLIEELLKPYPNRSALVSEFGEEYVNNTVVDYNTLLYNRTTTVEDVLLSCKFGGYDFNCSHFNEYLSHNGQCFTLNSVTEVEVLGEQHGMELLLWLGEDNSFPFDPSSPIFKIVLHDHDEEEPNMDTAQVVGASFTHYVTVDSHKYKYLENPVEAYGGQYCINTELPEFKHYTTAACYSHCRELFIYNHCGCLSPYQHGSTECTISKFVDCFKPASSSFSVHKDQCYCPIPCEGNQYTSSLHSVSLPDRSFTTWNKQLSLNKSTESLKQNMMVIKVFFNSNNVAYHEQTLEYKFEDLWASIGGILGLTTGASVLSFLEIIDIFVWNLFYHFQNIIHIMRRDTPVV